MYIPISTYRIQANKAFQFKNLKQVIDYLEALGISTIYCSPFFAARPDSDHGYDVVNPYLINPEIGTLKELEEIAAVLKEKELGWLQDIVPNHMAFDSNNVWLMDIFEKGPHSDFYHFFDIDWNAEDLQLRGKVTAPFLGSDTEQEIKDEKLMLVYTQGGFFIKGESLQYPVSWKSCYYILEQCKPEMDAHQFYALLEDFKNVGSAPENPVLINETPHYLEVLYDMYKNNSTVKKALDTAIYTINKNVELFSDLLDLQFYKLAFHRTSDTQINYRRFFAVNELISLSAENEKVFTHSHELISECINSNLVQGVRVDHIDGLYNPEAYLQQLRSLVGKDTYVVIEKILGKEEQLPESWPVQGTSGYDFLAMINDLFTKEDNLDKLNEIYENFVSHHYDYAQLVFEAKVNFLCRKMAGELDNLFSQLKKIIDIPEDKKHLYRESLAVILASFPVYRIYPASFPLQQKEIDTINGVIRQALKFRPFLADQLHQLGAVLVHAQAGNMHLEFLMRLQQFTGPLAAKGIEDTAFYVYNRLISHNEVGDSPRKPGRAISVFHELMLQRCATPFSMSSTSTHDTKRGEDARIRINILSEMPDEWAAALKEWTSISAAHKQQANGKLIPDSNDEYFIYQTLVGAYPVEGIDEEFKERFHQYMVKALREAKVNTDWGSPNLVYEKAIAGFIDGILSDYQFKSVFAPFAQKVCTYGMVLSLSQVLVKSTVPGVPDIYQGSELWDLSFVDPDNRRPVDFDLRKRHLASILKGLNDTAKLISELMETRKDGRIKMFTTYVALEIRKSDPELFEKGEYIPLALSGAKCNVAIAYARKYMNRWALIVAPAEVVSLPGTQGMPLGKTAWVNTVVQLPEEAPEQWTDMFTGKEHFMHRTLSPVSMELFVSDENEIEELPEEGLTNQFALSKLLEQFPLALLYSNNDKEEPIN